MASKKEGLTLAVFLAIIVIAAAMFIGTYMRDSVVSLTGEATGGRIDITRALRGGVATTGAEKLKSSSSSPYKAEDLEINKLGADDLFPLLQNKLAEMEAKLTSDDFSTEKTRAIGEICLIGEECRAGVCRQHDLIDNNRRCSSEKKDIGEICSEDADCGSGHCSLSKEETVTLSVSSKPYDFLGRKIDVQAISRANSFADVSVTHSGLISKSRLVKGTASGFNGITIDIAGISTTSNEVDLNLKADVCGSGIKIESMPKTATATVQKEAAIEPVEIKRKSPVMFIGRFFTLDNIKNAIMKSPEPKISEGVIEGDKVTDAEVPEEKKTITMPEKTVVYNMPTEGMPDADPGSYEFEIWSADRRLKAIQAYVCIKAETTMLDLGEINCGGDEE
ncbi:MAG: hypothetical protein ABIB71_02000 [Candidatus Woesearchaeota archaeon]